MVNIYSVNNRVNKMHTVAYYILDATICLFSCQTFFLEDKGHGQLCCDKD
jgi:hypothetical protein